jgi:hypothetical protein
MGVSVTADGQKLPNIVIVYADDLGFGDLSCDNPKSAYKTPNLDRRTRWARYVVVKRKRQSIAIEIAARSVGEVASDEVLGISQLNFLRQGEQNGSLLCL